MNINDLEFNVEEIMLLKQGFEKSPLSKRIIGLLAHGSSLYFPLDPESRDSDIDLELILDVSCSDDLSDIGKILKVSPIKVECQLRYLDEIKSGLIFQSAYKLFMYYAYANGVLLIGENPYQELIKSLSWESVRQSLLISTQIAFKDVRKIFLGGGSEYGVNKSVMQVFRLICMFDGLIDRAKLGCIEYFEQQSKAFVPLILSKYGELLAEEDLAILRRFVRHYQSHSFLKEVFPVVNKVVSIFSKRAEEVLC